MKKRVCFLLAALACCLCVRAQFVSRAWCPDAGDGTYRNPVLMADYSDPDVIRVGDDYWMTSSSFNCVPGLQILHSTDLVNWEIVNAVFDRLVPEEEFSAPGHGNGVWAPSIRYHEGTYYVYWGDPDHGIYMCKSSDPRGEWSAPHLVKAGKGMIDTCPLWDDDGRAYLVHAWAGSRAGLKSVLSVAEMSPDGERLIGEEVLVFDGHAEHPTVEGPKFYTRNGYYYIFAPAGGVKPGWQIVLRSKNVYGPYECRTVMHRGDTGINGPHQGGWVDDVEGNHWFLHFQDRYAYGRVVHLQPMTWDEEDWCIIGVDTNGDGIGEPVAGYRKPASRVASAVRTPADSDDFDTPRLGLQWQWHANPGIAWYMLNPSQGFLRLYCKKQAPGLRNLWDMPNLLLQKLVAEEYTATAKLRFTPGGAGDRTGLVVMGMDYATLELRQGADGMTLCYNVCKNAIDGAAEERLAEIPFDGGDIWLRVTIGKGALCDFSYSTDGKRFKKLPGSFKAREGRWIGAKLGFYASSEGTATDGRTDIDYLHVER